MSTNICVDAGSDFCPCYLAETKDCITCSHMQGKDYCDCNWCGSCVFQEYVWNGKEKKVSRESAEFQIIDKRYMSENALIFKIKVTKTLARYLREPGAYVFLRARESQPFFDVPMSICDSDEESGIITIAIQIVGAKTKVIAALEDSVLVRGPYWGGIFGQKYVKTLKNSTCLIICRGIAQGPALLLGKKLQKSKNRVFYIIDKGRVEKNFILDEIKSLNCEYVEMNLLDPSSDKKILEIIDDLSPGLIFSSGSDRQHLSIMTLLDNNNISSPLIVTNNTEICCGEGICGSCITEIEKDVVVKGCKTQVDIKKLIERRIVND